MAQTHEGSVEKALTTGTAMTNPWGWRETQAQGTQSLQLVGIWKPD